MFFRQTTYGQNIIFPLKKKKQNTINKMKNSLLISLLPPKTKPKTQIISLIISLKWYHLLPSKKKKNPKLISDHLIQTLDSTQYFRVKINMYLVDVHGRQTEWAALSIIAILTLWDRLEFSSARQSHPLRWFMREERLISDISTMKVVLADEKLSSWSLDAKDMEREREREIRICYKFICWVGRSNTLKN